MNTDQVRHLLRRVAFTATPAFEKPLRGLQPEVAVSRLVAFGRQAPVPAFSAPGGATWQNPALKTKGMNAARYEELRRQQQQAGRLGVDLLRELWLAEMISGPSPLREVMVLFFHGTFGSSSTAVEIPQALAGTNALIRRTCLDTVPGLLEALVLDAGMMIQIGMDEHGIARVSDRPAKLILDHWTVGAGAYADRDVEELSRALTGWALHAPVKSFVADVDVTAPRVARRTGIVAAFDPGEFDDGPKTILGNTGMFDAKGAIAMLARRPETARRYARLLIRHLAIDDPRQRLETQLANTYQSTDGSIEALLRGAVQSDEFWAPGSRWSLVKSPVHLVVSACHQLDLADPVLPLVNHFLKTAGQTLFDTPNGGEGGWTGQDDWITPADRLGVRYQLPAVLAGRPLDLGVKAPAGSPAPYVVPVGAALRNASASTLVARLDAAPGVDTSGVGQNDLIRYVMATPQYQLA